MKLTRNKLIELIKLKNGGWTSYQVKKKIGVSVRRVDQIWSQYKNSGEIPELGKSIGRPSRPIKKDEEALVKESYLKYRVCAPHLRLFIKKDFNLDIPHYHIHKILLRVGFAKQKEKKDVRKKDWIRYERRHSLTAVHLDWTYHPKLKVNALPVLDDASRKLLALIEIKSATTDASIDAMKQALKHGGIQQCITDHGTQFWKGEDMKARFPAFLEQHDIKHIPTKIKHPQSNGKIEKFIHLYKKHRTAFKTKEDFMQWYNEVRPHMSLHFDKLETPEQAYQRKKKKGRQYYT